MSEDWKEHGEEFEKIARRVGLSKTCGFIGECNEGHKIYCLLPDGHEGAHGTCGTPCVGGHKDGKWEWKVLYK